MVMGHFRKTFSKNKKVFSGLESGEEHGVSKFRKMLSDTYKGAKGIV